MVFPEHESIDTKYLQRLFDNMSECYKLFWFQAVCEAAFEGKQTVSFDDLVNKNVLTVRLTKKSRLRAEKPHPGRA